MKTIIFMFGGRQANVELQLPYIRRILAENPDTEYHIWDLARHDTDSNYLRSIEGDRIHIITHYREPKPSRAFNKVWRAYTHPEFRNYRFLKIDDDIVYLDTHRFTHFIDHIPDDTVLSALTINNGASTRHIPDLWHGYQQLNIPLLDVHLNSDYADMCHRWFFQNWQETTKHPLDITATDDWMSINCIAMTYPTLCAVANLVGTLSPPEIAGRTFGYMTPVGDEGAVNMLPRAIHTGFTAAHLTFGPQITAVDETVWDEMRKMYADIVKQAL